MARKVMRSLWDISRDISRESLSTKPVGLVDDYTYGNRAELRENMIDGIPDHVSEDIIRDDDHNGIPDDMERKEPKAVIGDGAEETDVCGMMEDNLLDMAMDGEILEVDVIEIEIDPEEDEAQ